MPSIHIDVDPAEIGKNIQTEIPLVGNVRVILQQLLERDLTPEFFALLGEEEPLYAQFPDKIQLEYIQKIVRGVFAHGAELDNDIAKYAKGWRFARIDRVAAAIMRVTMFEILYMPDVPNKAAINEAVEIAKKYLDEDTIKFVNGILGSFVRTEFPAEN